MTPEPMTAADMMAELHRIRIRRLMKASRIKVHGACEKMRARSRAGVPVSENLPAFFADLGIDPRRD